MIDKMIVDGPRSVTVTDGYEPGDIDIKVCRNGSQATVVTLDAEMMAWLAKMIADYRIAKEIEPEDAADRFSWLRAAVWSREYSMPLEWCERALEACRRADVDPSYIERKYLKREPVERIEAVDAAMMEILLEQRDEAKQVAERQRGRNDG